MPDVRIARAKMGRMKADPTQRFSSRVEDYIRFRPGYPVEVVVALRRECGLTSASRVADIGCGTGNLARLFLENGNPVVGVEPNGPMREAARRLLGHDPNFRIVDGRAEATTLPDESADFVTAGQAFHWFDRERSRREFRRILADRGWVVLIWNERDTTSTPFLRAYEALLRRFGTDYEQVDHRRIDERVLEEFFADGEFAGRTFPNRQVLDLPGLRGRLRSSSYTPEPGHPQFRPMQEAVDALFREHASGGNVCLEYETRTYFGHLN